MKKLAVLLAIVIAMSAMCVSAFAVDTSKIYIQPQIWAQNTVDYSDWTPLKDANGKEAQIELGDTATVVYTGDAWRALNSTAFQYGIQILDGTVDQTTGVAGDKTKIKYEISDVVFEATGYETYTAPIAGVYEADLECYVPDWGGIAGNTHVPGTIDLSGVAGGSDATSLMNYWAALESVTLTITYLEYNGEGPAASEEAPAEETPAVEETPAEETPAEETPADTAEEPADTGLALAIVPMVVAMAAVALSKKR